MYVKKYGSRFTGSYRKSYRKKTGSTGKYRRYRKKTPARFHANRKRLYSNKRVGRMLNHVAENKLIALQSQDENQPTPIQTGAQATFIAYVIGTSAAGINGAVTVGGISMSQGTQENQRIGNYAFYKKTHITLRVEMNAGNNSPPIQFRFIIAKLRRYANPAGITPGWSTSGFLEEDGTPFGHESSNKSGLDLIMQPLNKRTWVILKDRKFILQPYNDLASGGSSVIYNNYPAAKQMVCNLPYYKKSYFDGSSALTPSDLEFRYVMILYGHTLGRSGIVANTYECSLRGTTSFIDI